MTDHTNDDLTLDELNGQRATELPGRDLMLGLSLLGLPLATLDGLTVNINTAGPNWLGSIGR